MSAVLQLVEEEELQHLLLAANPGRGRLFDGYLILVEQDSKHRTLVKASMLEFQK